VVGYDRLEFLDGSGYAGAVTLEPKQTSNSGSSTAPAGEVDRRSRDGGGDPNPREFRERVRTTEATRDHAKALRQSMTLPERMLWSRLKRSQLAGTSFRKQHPLGPYIADFYCHHARLIVEVDGSTHKGERKNHDAVRDAWMRSRGIEILRVPAVDVLVEIDRVLSRIHTEVGVRSRTVPDRPLRHPADATSPAGAGEEPDSRCAVQNSREE
jgi:very-short-patch-repair endonuclease